MLNNLSVYEQILVDKVKLGEAAIWPTEQPRPTIRGDVIRALLIGQFENAPEPGYTVNLRHVAIDNDIDLRGMTILARLVLIDCKIEGELHLADASARTCVLEDTQVRRIAADRVQVNGSFLFRENTTVENGIALRHAQIRGVLDLSRAHISSTSGEAIVGNGATIDSVVFMQRGFTSNGCISFLDARLGGLYAEQSLLRNENGLTLIADGAVINGRLLLRNNFKSEGGVSLVNANIAGAADFSNAQFLARNNMALNVRGLKVRDAMSLQSVKIEGQVELSNAEIGGQLVLIGACLNGFGKPAFRGVGLHVHGPVWARGMQLVGHASIVDAVFEKVVDLSNSHLVGTEGITLLADRARFNGSISLSGILSERGTISMISADIDGDLDLGGACLEFSNGLALNADRINVGGMVFLREMQRNLKNGSLLYCQPMIFGSVKFVSAAIKKGIIVSRINLMDENAFLSFYAINVEGILRIGDNDFACGAKVDLGLARIGTLADKSSGWPTHGTVVLDGLRYDRLGEEAPTDPRTRCAWLELQPESHRSPTTLRPQPFEQLAKVLREMGHIKEAREIGLAKRRLARRGKPWYSHRWENVIDWTICYGYQPFRVLLFAVLLVAMGTCLFWFADQEGAMLPTDSAAARAIISTRAAVATKQYPLWLQRYAKELNGEPLLASPPLYPPFNPVIFALDAFVPVVDLQQERYWLPRLHPTWCSPWRELFVYAHWTLIVLGWFLTTIVVAGLTGFIKRD